MNHSLAEGTRKNSESDYQSEFTGEGRSVGEDEQKASWTVLRTESGPQISPWETVYTILGIRNSPCLER